MFILIAAFIGLVMNGIRGGGLTDYTWKHNIINEMDEGFIKPFSKVIHDIIFAALFSYGFDVSLDGKGLLCFLTLYVAMWCGRSIGWGAYIGGLIDREVKKKKEVAFIDKLVMRKSDHPVLRNVAALSLRGMIWTVSLAVGLASLNEQCFSVSLYQILLIAFSGLLMGVTYFLAIGFNQKLKRFTKLNFGDWRFSECVWGFVLWGTCAKILFGV